MIKIISEIERNDLEKYELPKLYLVYSLPPDHMEMNADLVAIASTEEEGEDAYELLTDLYGCELNYVLFPPQHLVN